MKITYSKEFIKQAEKLPPKLQLQLYERITLFRDNPLHSRLRNHALKGKYSAYRSINITGGYRALYLQREDEAIFDKIGTHSQLYG
jgi:addiction module RelE/StbE family toxin